MCNKCRIKIKEPILCVFCTEYYSKGVAQKKQPLDIDDICNACECLDECILAYTEEAYKCQEEK